jgi:GT2 family glycosyltransferase
VIDLSVIIVNYRSASFTLHAVASALGHELESEGGGRGELEALVIDNGSPPEDVAMLEGLPQSVRVIRNPTNLGFAAAVNQGIGEAKGDAVCLLNPDTHLLPGAFQGLLEHLHRFPDVAASGPRTWWDEEKTFLLPLVRMPTPASMVLESLAGLNYRLSRSLCRPWHRRDLALWRATVPMTIDMLCGACLMIRREVVDRVGRFDPTFSLYYEDADWCRRARRRGYRFAFVPAAEIVHYYNQSAQVAWEQSREWFDRSRSYYLQKQFGRWPAALCRRITAMIGRLAERWDPALPDHLYVDLGPQEEPPLFRVGEADVEREVLFEVSYGWNFAFKAAAFRFTPELRFPLAIWKRLQPGRYYTRFTDLTTGRQEKIWSWQKV